MTRIVAMTREVSPAIVDCELTHLSREPIDLERARAQHAAYEACLRALGCQVIRLPVELDLPDAVFVEDAAVVLDELAVITRPGAASRRAETASVAAALAPYRRLSFIGAPGTLDGGDVLVVDRRVFVGASSRSNAAGVEQLALALAPFGYQVKAVAVEGCLHLKSAVTVVAPDTVLVNRRWIDPRLLDDQEVIEIDPAEPFAANVLRVNGRLLCPASCPSTVASLERRGLEVMRVDLSELAKAEGALTCCSLLVRTEGAAPR